MSRIASGVAEATGNTAVKVIIDVNPDIRSNTQFADQICPGNTRAQQRLKQFLGEKGIQYFTVSGVNDGDELQAVVVDYAASNLGEDEQFVLVCDRVPSNLDDLLGGLKTQFAGIYSK